MPCTHSPGQDTHQANDLFPNMLVQARLQAHSHYVQGVCWDPLGHFLASQSADRSVRVYGLKPPPAGVYVWRAACVACMCEHAPKSVKHGYGYSLPWRHTCVRMTGVQAAHFNALTGWQDTPSIGKLVTNSLALQFVKSGGL